jgi:regulator of replication initiation timing
MASDELGRKAADEIERLTESNAIWQEVAKEVTDVAGVNTLIHVPAEIERLQETAQVMWDEWTYLKARNEKLEKVLEHAKHLLAGGDEEAVHHLNKAIAAVEERDDE